MSQKGIQGGLMSDLKKLLAYAKSCHEILSYVPSEFSGLLRKMFKAARELTDE